MAHEAIVASLTNVRPHPNADRLQLATVAGYQIVVGLDQKEGDIGVFFYPELQLSEEMCTANDLIDRNDPVTGEKAGGYFARNRRVRAQRLRGEKSEGYWTEFSSFEFTNYDMRLLKEGDLFDQLNGVPICNKYFTPATLKAMANRDRILRQNPCFAKHVETEKFQYSADKIPTGSMIYITEKLHGTSGRYGYVMDSTTTKLKWYQRIRLENRGLKEITTKQYDHLIGTRNTILGKWEGEDYYGADPFRQASVKNLEGNLRKGEMIYYEIVGYTDGGGFIMGEQDTSVSKEIKKAYGPKMSYTYGCIPGQCKIYVYRITQVNEDGHAVELSWNQVKKRCGELGISYVPEISDPIYYQYHVKLEDIKDIVEDLMVGSSVLDETHIREGVVLRCEQPNGEVEFYKSKSFEFGLLEGYIKEKDDHIDLEEVS